MKGARILVVDDEPQIRRFLQTSLRQVGYDVSVASSAQQALAEIRARLPDLILVDLMLPEMDGIALTRLVRSERSVPLIVLSAIVSEQKAVEALDGGADDYVTKPFGMAELHARIKSVLRRWARSSGAEASFVAGEISVNFERREVRVGSEIVHLTPKEYELLKFMIEHVGKTLTHRMLLTAVWGASYADRAQYLRVFVGQLRKKIAGKHAESLIITEPGVGYKLCQSQ